MDEKELFKSYQGKYFILEQIDESFNQNTSEISLEVYENLRKATITLYEYKYFERKLREIQLNFQEYFDKVKYYENWLIENGFQKFNSELDNVYIDINRVFINFITSLKVFMEHLENRLRKKYGKDSIQVQKFKKITNRNYDQYFSYRLFIRLRNYSIHYGYPIQNINFSNDYKDKQYRLIPSFDKAKLLEHDELRRKLRYDLNLRNKTFPVEHQMLEIQKCLRTILTEILEIENERYDESADLIIKYHLGSKTQENVAFGYAKYDEINNRIGWLKSMLEIDIAKKIKENSV